MSWHDVLVGRLLSSGELHNLAFGGAGRVGKCSMPAPPATSWRTRQARCDPWSYRLAAQTRPQKAKDIFRSITSLYRCPGSGWAIREWRAKISYLVTFDEKLDLSPGKLQVGHGDDGGWDILGSMVPSA